MKEKETTTDFKGPVSLEAIFAATSKTKTVDIVEETPPVENKKEVKPKEEEVQKPVDTAKPAEAKPTETKEQEPKVETPAPKESEAYKAAKRMIALGVLNDFSVQTSEEDEEGTPISEFRDMTEENLQEIIAIHNQEKNNEISSKYITKEGLKEHHLKVVEILKNGGDLSQIAETEEKAFERPFEGYDLNDKKNCIDILYTDLTSGKGLKHEKAIDLIKIAVDKGTISDDAQEIFDNYRKAHAEYIDKIYEDQKKAKEIKDFTFKENKKALTEKLKEAGLKETVYKKVASEYAKKNDNGDYLLIDKLREALDNPEENHELILHLADKQLFNDTFKIKASHEAQKTIVKLASQQANKGNKQVSRSQPEEQNAPWLKIAEAWNSNIKQ